MISSAPIGPSIGFLANLGLHFVRMETTTRTKAFFFYARLYDKSESRILQIGPAGLRLLTPRGSSAAAAVHLTVSIVVLGTSLLMGPPLPSDDGLVRFLLAIALATIALLASPFALWIGPFAIPPRFFAARPREAIDLQFRAAEPHFGSNWIWVNAGGQETWVVAYGRRRKLDAAMHVASRPPASGVASG